MTNEHVENDRFPSSLNEYMPKVGERGSLVPMTLVMMTPVMMILMSGKRATQDTSCVRSSPALSLQIQMKASYSHIRR